MPHGETSELPGSVPLYFQVLNQKSRKQIKNIQKVRVMFFSPYVQVGVMLKLKDITI